MPMCIIRKICQQTVNCRTPFFSLPLAAPPPASYGRQLDGMGGGFTAVSKACVIGPPTRDDADIDYTFAQIPTKEQRVEYAANCGNMSSAMGRFAVDEGLALVRGSSAACA